MINGKTRIQLILVTIIILLAITIPLIIHHFLNKTRARIRHAIEKQMPRDFSCDSISLKSGRIHLKSLSYKDILKAKSVSVKPDFRAIFNIKGNKHIDLKYHQATFFGLPIAQGEASLDFDDDRNFNIEMKGAAGAQKDTLPFWGKGKGTMNGKDHYLLRDLQIRLGQSAGTIDSFEIKGGHSAGVAGEFGIYVEEVQEIFKEFKGISGFVRVKGVLKTGPAGRHGSVEVSADSLLVEGIMTKELNGSVAIKDGQYKIAGVRLNAFDGRIMSRGTVKQKQGVLAYDLNIELKNIDINQLPQRPADIKFSGKYSGTVQVSGKAESIGEIIRKIRLFE
jgi:hypothetical protein